MADLADYLQLSVDQARDQFRSLRTRQPVTSGRRVTFLPVETLLCLAAASGMCSRARSYEMTRARFSVEAKPPDHRYLNWHRDHVFTL